MLEYLYQALRSDRGVCIRITAGSFDTVRQKLYAARREACDEALADLAFVQSPTAADELWIVRRVIR